MVTLSPVLKVFPMPASVIFVNTEPFDSGANTALPLTFAVMWSTAPVKVLKMMWSGNTQIYAPMPTSFLSPSVTVNTSLSL